MSDRLSCRTRARRFPHLEALEDRSLPSVDVVLEWNAIALDALQNDSTLAHPRQNNPGNASRVLAMTQAAVFDAVNSIDRSYEPYLIELDAPRGTSITAAAAQAAHDTLIALFPEYKPTLDARLANDLLTSGGSLLSRVEGVLVGHFVAAAMLTARSHDGSDATYTFIPGTGPGQWQPDPLHPTQIAWGPLWGDVTPFAIKSSTQFYVPPPPALTSQAYADAYNEVKTLGGDGIITPTTRTAEETQIGIFWGYDGSSGVGTPPRLYNQIAEVLAVQMHNTVIQNARFFALINLAMGDAAIAGWEAKFDYDFWRPVTAIRAGNTDGNPLTVADPTWTPLGAPADNVLGATNFTPPFPAYVSGHATFGGALFTMMANFFGTDDVHFTIGSDEFNGVTKDQNGLVRPVVTRSFDSFSQAAEENGQSRIYLGIHWEFDKDQGILLGSEIADYVFANLLRPVHHGHDGRDGDGGRGGDDAVAVGGPGNALPSTNPAQDSGGADSSLGQDNGLFMTGAPPALLGSVAGTTSATNDTGTRSNDPLRPLVLDVPTSSTPSVSKQLVAPTDNADPATRPFNEVGLFDTP